ncbi:MAG: hypothetical protein H5T42_01585 [Methanothrix sp.]|uniref:Uncharacterized protein n=1 Tax=Methanothrix thermoacetophila (strain DSM 6194 / JCM 14653 / NBRC 101360 / PT) TaxID=349307 RepID=A0B980_METTP|nr:MULTISPECIES: hypothetical protein [Methanothrix]ABK15254.1 hypothetical protein Mthe_1481 [Methanothrix thermoacetophila PT]MBC7079159.1 hypothetical protein [Methanothrix sp.]NPU86623.1 hypothetical protein [Methanothrix sp.]
MRYLGLIITFVFFVWHASAGLSYIQVKDVTMIPDGDDLKFNVNYTLEPFARLYVLALGCRHIEPELVRLFSSYQNVKTVKAKPSTATLVVENAGTYLDGYYLYDAKPLSSPISRFTVVYPEGVTRTFINVTSTPSIFVEKNALRKAVR